MIPDIPMNICVILCVGIRQFCQQNYWNNKKAKSKEQNAARYGRRKFDQNMLN